eukprot:14407816-Alexandrium_andersonii.AAC.1
MAGAPGGQPAFRYHVLGARAYSLSNFSVSQLAQGSSLLIQNNVRNKLAPPATSNTMRAKACVRTVITACAAG